jgi:DNA-binding MarR family transcriptional regulator
MSKTANRLKQDESHIFNVPVRRLAVRLQTLVQRGVLRPHGLKIQEWRVLWSLAREGDTHLRELGRRASVDAAHVSRLIRKLERQQLIARRRDPEDNRRTLFQITETGLELYREVRPKAVAISDEFKMLYSEDEYETLMTLIDRAIAKADSLLENEDFIDD